MSSCFADSHTWTDRNKLEKLAANEVFKDINKVGFIKRNIVYIANDWSLKTKSKSVIIRLRPRLTQI